MFSIVAKVYNTARVQVGWTVTDGNGNLTMVSAEQAMILYQNKKISEYCPFNGVQITSKSYDTNMFKVYLDGTPIDGGRSLFIINSVCRGQNGVKTLEGYTVLRLSKVGLKVFRYRLSDMQILSKSNVALNGRMMSDGRVVPKVGQFPTVSIKVDGISKKSQGASTKPMTMEDWKKYCEFDEGCQGYWLTHWKGNGEVAVIPPFITYIEDNAFDECSLLKCIKVAKGNKNYVSIDGVIFTKNMKRLVRYPLRKQGEYTVPDSVEEIEGSAFSDCAELMSVAIPNSVKRIGDNAFRYCTGLTNVVIPDSVTWMSTGVFSYCNGLINVTIGKGVSCILDGAFGHCTGLTNITIPDSVKSIDDYVFYGCTGLTSVTIPNSVRSIGFCAFYGCTGLTSVTIPNSVTDIGHRGFRCCDRLISINVDKDNKNYSSDNGVLFDKDASVLIHYPASKQGEYTIPNTVTKIHDSAFFGCTELSSITIPNSVTDIGTAAFDGCTGLSSITIPNSVTNMGSSAFDGCTGLRHIKLPKHCVDDDIMEQFTDDIEIEEY